MFKKLQRRYLWGSTIILFLVIVVVIGIIFWATSNTVTRQTQVFIDLVLDNDGLLPEKSEFAPQQETFLALNTESINEIRFFSVLISDGDAQVISKFMTAVSDEDAVNLAREALKKQNDSGHLNHGRPRFLHYGRKTMEDGSSLVIIADSTSRYTLTRLIVIYMAALWGVILILFILAMSHFSKKLVQPFIESDEKQKRFITNASHELKTPLAVIAANNEMSEAIHGKSKWTESTSRQISRLQSLIESLVVLTRLDEMKEIELTDVDFSRIVSDSAETFRGVIESSGKQYEVHIGQEIHVNSEKRTLQQIAVILLDNAAKYCDEGGTVSVSLTPKGNGARLSVSNSFAGGKDADTSRFFERFYRQDESHNSGKSGFGIGLSMAKEMTEWLKGKLNVHYAEGIITFTLDLP